jgi:hypothetical protein
MQEFTIKELRATLPAAIQELKALNIRPASVRSITSNTAELSAKIQAPVKDTIYIYQGTDPQAPAEPDTIRAKTINYFDKWIKIKGEISQDTADLEIAGADTSKTIIYQSRRHRWAWIFSRKEFRAVTTNKNPYIKLTPGKTILIKL